MKETSFIEQNKKKWNRFEQLYESKSNDPEELSDLYMDITDDLSYAQTFYERRTVRVYLNQLAQKVYTGVHKQKGEPLRKFITVWKTSLPLEIYRSRKNLLFALVLFLIYFVIGALTVQQDPYFLDNVTMGGYTRMTLDNIEAGNPLGVYAEPNFQGELAMFIRIATNNLKVAFLTFFAGFFLTLGTHILLFQNSVMVGAFQYFFYTKGLLVTSFLGIWIHGAFEISAIVIAAGAGLTAGNGLLFPKSYTRTQSLQLSTKRGLKIMMSLVPFVIAAAFLESFVTANYQDLPDWSKWTLILLSFGIITFFYVLYPIYVARKNPHLLDEEQPGNFTPTRMFDLNKIRGVGEQLSDSFKMYRVTFGRFTRINLLIVFPLILTVIGFQLYNHFGLMQREYWYDWASQLELMMGYGFYNLQDVIVLAGWTIIFTIIFAGVLWSVKTREEPFSWGSFFSYLARRGLSIWFANLLLMATVLLLPWYLILMAITLIPLFYLNGASAGLDEEKFGRRLKRGFQYSSQQYGKALLLLLIFLGLTVIALQPVAFVLSIHEGFNNRPIVPDFLDLITEFIKRIGQIFYDGYEYIAIANGFRQVVYALLILFLLPMLVISMAFGYYSELERTEAKGLRRAFEKFGKRSRTHETEVDFD